MQVYLKTTMMQCPDRTEDDGKHISDEILIGEFNM